MQLGVAGSGGGVKGAGEEVVYEPSVSRSLAEWSTFDDVMIGGRADTKNEQRGD